MTYKVFTYRKRNSATHEEITTMHKRSKLTDMRKRMQSRNTAHICTVIICGDTEMEKIVTTKSNAKRIAKKGRSVGYTTIIHMSNKRFVII